MAAEGDHRHASTLRDYLAVVRRRKWIILQAVILVPLTAVLLSIRQDKMYSACAQVLVNYDNLANTVTGTNGGSSVYQPVERIAETQAELAQTPPVANRVIQALGLRNYSTDSLLSEVSVVANPSSNLLNVCAEDADAAMAPRIATSFAHQFKNYRADLDTSTLRDAIKSVQVKLKQLSDDGQASSPLYSTLASRLELLKTMETLQTSNTFVVKRADWAVQVSPRPLRDGILGLILGVVLGIGLAFLREGLDTRVRSSDEVGERLGLPLLARLPEPPRRLRRDDRLVMVSDPTGAHAESFRMLRTNLDFVRLDRDVKTIMVTSAVEAEGKSTTAANLAAALARVGQRVSLVDLDLRRPYLHKFFDLEGRPGLTQVALGHAKVEDALATIPLVRPGKLTDPLNDPLADPASGNGSTNGRVEGLLEVLGSGPVPPNVDEFVGTRAVAEILARLRERSDVVIIDSTPLLVVGDAMALTRSVDALLIVTRMNVVRRPMLRELHRVLEATPTFKLGFVVTGTPSEDGYYGYDSYSYRSRAYGRRTTERIG
jgi:polysaccharide biosynthesis transport protein